MNGKYWTPAELARLRTMYPDSRTADLVARFKRSAIAIYGAAQKLGLSKSEAFHVDEKKSGRFNKLTTSGVPFRYPKGHVPANAGLRRPGYAPGRMRETQFKKGGFPVNRDPDFYVLGALRVNSDGYIDMRISFAPGACGWRMLHLILWEDEHGPVPKGHCLAFKDRDRLNVCLENIELITRAELCRRNSVHNLPPALKQSVQLLGALKRTINRRTRDEEQNRGSAGSPVRDARGSAG